MEDKANLKEEVLRLGRVTGFPIMLLEKDYHLTKILHKISEKNIETLVFKGGTCLNKCYLGFYRLSEDLDFVFNQDVKGLSKIQIKKIRPIHHEFIDSLGEPILKEDVKIESIDLSENFAEKFRALVTRKNIAVRDIYDIHFILKKNILKI